MHYVKVKTRDGTHEWKELHVAMRQTYRQRFTVERWRRISYHLASPMTKRLRSCLAGKADDEVVEITWTVGDDDFQSLNMAAFLSAKEGEKSASLYPDE